jgi:DNA adenine methylase
MLSPDCDMWTRPILRWAGSKRKLLPKLIACVPQSFDRYIEPFLGSACLFLALKPKKAVLGDFNHELMKTYSVLRKLPSEVAEAVHNMPSSVAYYYTLRAKSPQSMSPVDRAARFIYLNRHCFNGVYRANRSGQFNVPRGIHTGKIPTIAEFRACAVAFRNAELRRGDFESCLTDIRSGDFIYLDPPYASCSRLDHGEYGYDSFNEDDIERLIKALKRADRRGATILLSYASTPILQHALPRWYFRTIKVRRYVAGFEHQRLEVKEVLVSNKALPHNLNRVN